MASKAEREIQQRMYDKMHDKIDREAHSNMLDKFMNRDVKSGARKR